MTLGEHFARDARIAALEDKGRARTRAEDHELATLQRWRDMIWRRIGERAAALRRKLADVEAYARQHKLPLDA